jgi:transposase
MLTLPPSTRVFVKILWWDRDGLAIFYKRLEEGVFPFPTRAADAKEVEMTAADLQLVLQGIDPQKVKRTKRYTRTASDTAMSLVRETFAPVPA